VRSLLGARRILFCQGLCDARNQSDRDRLIQGKLEVAFWTAVPFEFGGKSLVLNRWIDSNVRLERREVEKHLLMPKGWHLVADALMGVWHGGGCRLAYCPQDLSRLRICAADVRVDA